MEKYVFGGLPCGFQTRKCVQVPFLLVLCCGSVSSSEREWTNSRVYNTKGETPEATRELVEGVRERSEGPNSTTRGGVLGGGGVAASKELEPA